jgi:ribosomal protein L12E/L44/L45/RPP1/RPP2
MTTRGVNVSPISVDDEKLKSLLKAAVVEILEERTDLLQEAIVEALEEVALVRAIEEGERTKQVTRREVFAALDGDR